MSQSHPTSFPPSAPPQSGTSPELGDHHPDQQPNGAHTSQSHPTTTYSPSVPPQSGASLGSGDQYPPPNRELRWRIVDIVVAAVLGVAVGLIFFSWNFVGDTIGDALKLIFPSLKGLVGGMWLLGGVLGGLIIRKPGAAIFVEMVAALVPTLLGSPWGITVLVSGLLQGAGAELVFLVFRYRAWKLPVAILAGVMAGAFEWVYDIINWYAGWQPLHKGIYLACLAFSGAILAGCLGWLIQRGLARTGVLDRFESGREARSRI